jgi:group II intron reverse transcriptase/maturase
LKQVESRKGSGGVDGMQSDELRPYLVTSWVFLKADILDGSYKPAAVKKVEIPKPNGGTRILGVPTVLDRFIQQAISQYLVHIYDDSFSDRSYGFRPGRSAHQAVGQAQKYLNAGYDKVIEIDLEKFFDIVNHDRLMSILSRRITDKRLLNIISKYLRTGIMSDGKIETRRQGTPQGSPLSPVLSNIVLDELDKELEKRGHKFVRYADDLSIYVRSSKAAERVSRSIHNFIEKKMKLKVNKEKSRISTPLESNLLGFSFYHDAKGWQIRIGPKSYLRLKSKLKRLTSRSWSISMADRLRKLREFARGWVGYFRIARCRSRLCKIDSWVRFRLRMCLWKSWKKVKTRISNLIKLGMKKHFAYIYSYTRKSYCRTAHSYILTKTLTNEYFTKQGYADLEGIYLKMNV